MRSKIILVLIILLAAILRFTNLSINPPSLNWDEASLGYNAWTLLQYGTDEYGNTWPFSIRSFNDYKPPLYSYLTMFPVAIFGLNEFSTRFVSALLGTLTTLVVYFLTKELFGTNDQDTTINHQKITNYQSTKNSRQKNNKLINSDWTLNDHSLLDLGYSLPVISALLFAISPWSLQFSRGAFEGNIAVFFTSLGMLFLLKWLNNSKNHSTIHPFINLSVAAFSFILALYSYHAARLVIPLFAVLILIRYYAYILKRWKSVFIIILVSSILILPLVIITFRGSTGARVEAVSIFNPKYTSNLLTDREQAEKNSGNQIFALLYDTRVQYLGLVLQGYFDHYNLSDLFIKGDVVDRHHAPSVGLLYLIELPFILIGLYVLAVQKYRSKYIFWIWWLIAPLPAALASGTPHAIRSILWLPLPQIATAVGLITATTLIASRFVVTSSKSKPRRVLTTNLYIALNYGMRILISSIFLLNFSYYLIQYHVHQPVENARDWQYGYKQLVQYLSPIYPQFDRVIMTTSLDQPYIFFLFYEKYKLENGVNPGDFNRHFKNITFESIDIFKLRAQYQQRPDQTLLIIGAADEIPDGEPIEMQEIKFPDGNISLRVVKFVEGK